MKGLEPSVNLCGDFLEFLARVNKKGPAGAGLAQNDCSAALHDGGPTLKPSAVLSRLLPKNSSYVDRLLADCLSARACCAKRGRDIPLVRGKWASLACPHKSPSSSYCPARPPPAELAWPPPWGHLWCGSGCS